MKIKGQSFKQNKFTLIHDLLYLQDKAKYRILKTMKNTEIRIYTNII